MAWFKGTNSIIRSISCTIISIIWIFLKVSSSSSAIDWLLKSNIILISSKIASNSLIILNKLNLIVFISRRLFSPCWLLARYLFTFSYKLFINSLLFFSIWYIFSSKSLLSFSIRARRSLLYEALIFEYLVLLSTINFLKTLTNGLILFCIIIFSFSILFIFSLSWAIPFLIWSFSSL